eukprot:TRINITY_DN40058_c0_g1_i1.p1 TRINITY_DN40058_c0_g1~~TRINITY_DN40058_c0_g1_i1.p1  ORF type:complete len:203 (+),score=39.88 TRINITY_DN40058_c0_g1_i1:65-673(+)
MALTALNAFVAVLSAHSFRAPTTGGQKQTVYVGGNQFTFGGGTHDSRPARPSPKPKESKIFNPVYDVKPEHAVEVLYKGKLTKIGASLASFNHDYFAVVAKPKIALGVNFLVLLPSESSVAQGDVVPLGELLQHRPAYVDAFSRPTQEEVAEAEKKGRLKLKVVENEFTGKFPLGPKEVEQTFRKYKPPAAERDDWLAAIQK